MIILLGVVQVILLMSQQQSLTPLLTIFVASSNRKHPKISKTRITVYLFFIAWIASLSTLPLFYDRIYALFVVGDISLYWQVMIGPPRYSNPNFGIAAGFCVISIILFALIARDFSKRSETTGTETESGQGSSLAEKN